MFITSLLSAFIIFSFSTESQVTISIAQFKIENVSFIFEFMLIVFGASTYFSVDNLVKSQTIKSFVSDWVEKSANELMPERIAALHWGRRDFVALCKIKCGFDVFEFIALKPRIKTKLLIERIHFSKYLKYSEDFISYSVFLFYTVSYLSSLLAVASGKGSNILTSLIAATICTIFLAAALLKLSVLISLYLAVLAKGSRENFEKTVDESAVRDNT